MGLFGFVADLTSAAVKVVVSPIAVVVDVVTLPIADEPFSNTGNVLGSAMEDLSDAVDEII